MPLPIADRAPAVLLDVDGTLCDVRSIRYHVDGTGRRDFDAFHAASIDCPPHARVVALAVRARDLGYRVVVVSARNARWSFVTTAWLDEHGVAYDELMLRGRTDLRPDHEVKTDIGRLLTARHRVALAVDDREDIREVWWSFGIPVALVDGEGAIGRPSPALASADGALGGALSATDAVGPSGLEPLTPSV